MSTEHGMFSVVLKLDGLNVVNIDNKDVYKCVLKEDIYSLGTVGKLIIFDKYGLKEYGPLTGDEKLVLMYGKTSTISREFSLLKLSKISSVVEFQQAKTSVIELYFVDSFYINLTLKKYSKSWGTGTKASAIVEDIVKKMLEITKTINIEASETYFDNFSMPYWSPAEAIRYLSDRSKGTRGKCNYGYLFYSNSKNYINYLTLDNLLNNGEVDRETYTLESSITVNDNRILSWEIAGVDHTGIRELGGGQMLGFDPATKEFIGIQFEDSFVYSTAVKQISTLGSSSLFDGKYIDNNSNKFNYMYELSGETDKTIIKNIFYNNFIRRYSLQNSVKLLVTGHDKRFIGQKINIQWPSMVPNNMYSSLDSGQYLIRSIVHSFSPLTTPFYVQTLQCIKNAYEQNKYGSTTASSTVFSNFDLGSFS
jgi:hypothetical protein